MKNRKYQIIGNLFNTREYLAINELNFRLIYTYYFIISDFYEERLNTYCVYT